MQPILVQLERINKDGFELKERLFDWIADLSQHEFDQLCSEVIAVQRFFQKYDGVIVTDMTELVQPFKTILPKVELIIEIDDKHFDRVFFYRWLQEVDIALLQSVCRNLEDAYDLVIENLNTYVVTKIFPAIYCKEVCWYIHRPAAADTLLSISTAVQTWKTGVLREERIPA